MTTPSAKTARLLLTALIAAAVFAPAAGGAEKVTLQVKYLPGKYLTTMNQDMTQTVTVGERVQQQVISSTMVMEMTVGKPDPNDTRKAKIVYKRIKQSMKMGTRAQEFDSADPAKAGGALAGALKPLIGTELTLTIAKDNQVTDVAGLAELFDKQAQANPAAARINQQMKASMTKTLKGLISKSAVLLPKGPVGPGDKWDVETPMAVPVIGQMKVKQSCALQKLEPVAGGGKAALIAVKGSVKTEKPTTNQLGGVRMTVHKMDIAYDGSMRFDVALGVAESSTTKMKGLFSMSITGPNGQTQQVATKLGGTVNVTVKKLADK
jgi:hypothetical protein